MKKILYLVVAIALVLTFAACAAPIHPTEGENGTSNVSWPDNEFTEAIPSIDFGTLAAITSTETMLAAHIQNPDMDKALAYQELLIEAGFTMLDPRDSFSSSLSFSDGNEQMYLTVDLNSPESSFVLQLDLPEILDMQLVEPTTVFAASNAEGYIVEFSITDDAFNIVIQK